MLPEIPTCRFERINGLGPYNFKFSMGGGERGKENYYQREINENTTWRIKSHAVPGKGCKRIERVEVPGSKGDTIYNFLNFLTHQSDAWINSQPPHSKVVECALGVVVDDFDWPCHPPRFHLASLLDLLALVATETEEQAAVRSSEAAVGILTRLLLHRRRRD